MSTTINTVAQAEVLYAQFQAIVASDDDREVVSFWQMAGEELAEVLTEEELDQLEAKANEAEARLEAAKEIAAKDAAEKAAKKAAEEAANEQRTNCERRQKIAGILQNRKFDEAAMAVLTELYGKDASQLRWISKEICAAVEPAGLYGWAKWHAYQHANAAQASAEEQDALSFVKSGFAILADLTADCVSEKQLQDAERAIKFVRPSAMWQTWALKALERVIDADQGQLAKMAGIDLAGKVKLAHAEFRGASVLIDSLPTRVLARVAMHRAANKAAALKAEANRRARQLERAGACQAMRGSNQSADNHGHGKKKSKK